MADPRIPFSTPNPASAEELLDSFRGLFQSETLMRRAQRRQLAPRRLESLGPPPMGDPARPPDAGWGLILAPAGTPGLAEHLEALQPLIARRAAQLAAGPGSDGTQRTVFQEAIARNAAGTGWEAFPDFLFRT